MGSVNSIEVKASVKHIGGRLCKLTQKGVKSIKRFGGDVRYFSDYLEFRESEPVKGVGSVPMSKSRKVAVASLGIPHLVLRILSVGT